MAFSILACLITSSFISFFLCFSMGANDESMSSPYGSRALSMKWCLIIGSTVELIGSVILGSDVTTTIQGDLFSISEFSDNTNLLALVYLASIIGSSILLLIASFFGLPVSTTHAVVGAVSAAAVAAKGWDILEAKELGFIAASWIVSPLMGLVFIVYCVHDLGGIISVIIWWILYFSTHTTSNPYRSALRVVPIFAAFCVSVVFLFIILKGFELEQPFWVAAVASIGFGLVVGLLFQFVAVKRIEKYVDAKFEKKEEEKNKDTQSLLGKGKEDIDYGSREPEIKDTKVVTPKQRVLFKLFPYLDKENPEFNGTNRKFNNADENSEVKHCDEIFKHEANKKVERVFLFLQILTSTMVAFARGTNDVSNGIGAFAGILDVYQNGEDATDGGSQKVPMYVLLIGGVGIALGLWFVGWRVIKNVGTGITELSPTRGVSIEVGTSVTVLLASQLGLPISSTHTLIGCVFAMGINTEIRNFFYWRKLKSQGVVPPEKHEKSVSLWAVGKMVLSWVVTIPLAGCLAAVIVASFKWTT